MLHTVSNKTHTFIIKITYFRLIYADVTEIIVRSFLDSHFCELNVTE